MRTAVIVHHERIRTGAWAISVRREEPPLDHRTVLACITNALARAQRDLVRERQTDVGELAFVATVDVRDVNLGGAFDPADSKCHFLPDARKRDRTDAS